MVKVCNIASIHCSVSFGFLYAQMLEAPNENFAGGLT